MFQDIARETLSFDFKASNEEMYVGRLLGAIGKDKRWIYFLSVFKSSLEFSHHLAEGVASLRCITKQRM